MNWDIFGFIEKVEPKSKYILKYMKIEGINDITDYFRKNSTGKYPIYKAVTVIVEGINIDRDIVVQFGQHKDLPQLIKNKMKQFYFKEINVHGTTEILRDGGESVDDSNLWEVISFFRNYINASKSNKFYKGVTIIIEGTHPSNDFFLQLGEHRDTLELARKTMSELAETLKK